MTAPVRLGRNDRCWCGSNRPYKRCHQATEKPLRPGRLSPTRLVPPEIPAPDYALSGTPEPEIESMVKSPEVVDRMRRAGRAAAEVLAVVGAQVRPGITTDDLDALAHAESLARGAYPSPLNYNGYPKSLCTSVNEVICHGIPDDRVLVDGDIVNLDVTVFLDGVHGDTSATFLVGEVDRASRLLVDVTRECLALGIEAVRPGRPVSDIGAAIEAHAEANGLGVVRDFVGHGVGEKFHTVPTIYHYFNPIGHHAHGAGDDVHHRAHDHAGRLAPRPLGRRLDRRHRRPPAERPVRAHARRHRRRRRDPHHHRPLRVGGRTAAVRHRSGGSWCPRPKGRRTHCRRPSSVGRPLVSPAPEGRRAHCRRQSAVGAAPGVPSAEVRQAHCRRHSAVGAARGVPGL